MVVDIGEVKRHIKPKADSTLNNMRKSDLIEYIRCLENNYNVAVSFNENQAKYIESLGALPVWIPVTERLPEQGQEVIVYDGGVLKPKVFCYLFWNPNYDNWARVTHWMPLPEPPKEEANESES